MLIKHWNKPKTPTTPELPEKAMEFAQAVGRMFWEDFNPKKRITRPHIEKLAQQYGIESQTVAKELTELAIVLKARQISSDNQENIGQTFSDIVQLYMQQINISLRTSQSVMMQQYSTPAPLSYVAAMYVLHGMPANYKVFEPSAGNGLLSWAIPQDKLDVNELDPIRFEVLRKQHYNKVTNLNASSTDFAVSNLLEKQYDGILTNPPFGVLEKTVEVDGWKIGVLDHLMAINALDCMKDNGRAAIIVGGHTEYDSLGRVKSGKNRTFINYLYHYYNVDEIINIDGKKLYSRQGTGFDVRLILINGRKQNPDGFAPIRPDGDKTIEKYRDLWTQASKYFTYTEKKAQTTPETPQEGYRFKVGDKVSFVGTGQKPKKGEIQWLSRKGFYIVKTGKNSNSIVNENELVPQVVSAKKFTESSGGYKAFRNIRNISKPNPDYLITFIDGTIETISRYHDRNDAIVQAIRERLENEKENNTPPNQIIKMAVELILLDNNLITL